MLTKEDGSENHLFTAYRSNQLLILENWIFIVLSWVGENLTNYFEGCFFEKLHHLTEVDFSFNRLEKRITFSLKIIFKKTTRKGRKCLQASIKPTASYSQDDGDSAAKRSAVKLTYRPAVVRDGTAVLFVPTGAAKRPSAPISTAWR